MTQETRSSAAVFARICETSTRLMGGQVGRSTMRELQKTVLARPDAYPWEEVVDRVLAEPLDAEALTRHALKSQRDWVVRGGRETPGKGVKQKAKSLVARLVAAVLFQMLYIPVVIVLLVLVKYKWPDLDVYRLLDLLPH